MQAPELIKHVNRKNQNFRIKKVCYCCGTVKRVGPHHVIPRSEGGMPIFDNIVWLCVECHDVVEGSSIGAWERIHTRKREERKGKAPEQAADRHVCFDWYQQKPQEDDRTPAEIELDAEIAKLEARHPDRSPAEWMPWHMYDDALSMEHWGLVQARLNLKWERPKREMTPEERQAVGHRLKAGREAHQNA